VSTVYVVCKRRYLFVNVIEVECCRRRVSTSHAHAVSLSSCVYTTQPVVQAIVSVLDWVAAVVAATQLRQASNSSGDFTSYELNWSDRKWSTKFTKGVEICATFSVNITAYFVLIGYRHCSELGRFILSSCFNETDHTRVRKPQSCNVNVPVGKHVFRTQVQFISGSCDVNEAL